MGTETETGGQLQGTLPEPALGWQVQAASTVSLVGGWGEVSKEKEEKERLQKIPRAAPIPLLRLQPETVSLH